MKRLITDCFNRNISKDQSRDTGMAMVLLLLISALSLKRSDLLPWAVVALLINMIAPQLYRPVAVLWLGLSHLLGTIVSKILLTLVFFGVVVPIGLARKLFGIDSLKLREFKTRADSVMMVRNHTFTGQDIEKPY